MLPEHPPSYSQSHDPQSLSFPKAPTADLPPIHHERTLPPLPAVLAEPRYRSEPVAEPTYTWPSSNPLTAYYQPGPSKLSPKNRTPPHMKSPTQMDLDAPDNGRHSGSVFIDDPDVRLAAEALGDLRSGMNELPIERSMLTLSRFHTFPATESYHAPATITPCIPTRRPTVRTTTISSYHISSVVGNRDWWIDLSIFSFQKL